MINVNVKNYSNSCDITVDSIIIDRISGQSAAKSLPLVTAKDEKGSTTSLYDVHSSEWKWGESVINPADCDIVLSMAKVIADYIKELLFNNNEHGSNEPC